MEKKNIWICKSCKKEFKRCTAKGRPDPVHCSKDCYWPTRTQEYLNEILRSSYEGHVVRKKGCWDWSGSFDRHGYGQIGCCRELRISKAHRASWIIHRGEIPSGMNVLHKCDNRKCTNPDHLYLGTCLENSRDMVYKDKQAKGEKNGCSKLKDSDVLEIRRSLQNGVSGAYLGKKFMVSKTIVSRIKLGKSYKHIGVDNDAAK